MAIYKVQNVSIKGITVCVPSHTEKNIELPNFESEEAMRIIDSTGVREKRVADDGITASDLCTKAAEHLMEVLSVERDSIDCLIFVATYRDYLQPTTSCIIHDRLHLKESCFAIDVPCGCPGWIYGLYIMSTFLQNGQMKKGLLLVGDTSTQMNFKGDKSSRPLFGDAGTATLMEFDTLSAELKFNFSTISKGWKNIITKEGGARHPFNLNSLNVEQDKDGYLHRPIDCTMDGMSVFAFSLTTPAKVAKELIDAFGEEVSKIDYFLCHQANKYIVDKIRKKMGFEIEKTPICLDEYGNTSNASIPLAISSRCSERVAGDNVKALAVAFGTGLMCGAAIINLNHCPNDIIEY